MNSVPTTRPAVLPLWEFSLSLYAEPGMEPLCLALQDEQGMNVIVLLWALWLDEQQLPYDSGLWHSGLSRAGQWQRWRIRPWRKLRRALPKRWPWLAWRRRVKSMELDAERQLLSQLERMTKTTERYLAGNTVSQQATEPNGLRYARQLPLTDAHWTRLQRIVQGWRQA